MPNDANGSPSKLLEHLSRQVDGWMEPFGWLLVPPFSELRLGPLLERIRAELDVEAVSLFLTDEAAPNQLKYASGVGYKLAYRDWVYYLNQNALTSHVFSRKVAINLSAQELARASSKAQQGPGVPFTGRCTEYLDSGEFRNIVAVPVVFEKSPLGVLKLENKRGKGKGQRFPPADFALAKILAHMIAIACQQRIYTRLWTEGENIAATSQTLDEYLDRVVKVLQKALNAECCSIFVEDHPAAAGGQKVLRFGGGCGYKADYLNRTYGLAAEGRPATALTEYLDTERAEVSGTEVELSSSGLPYTGRCRDYIASGTFRNFLGIALVESLSSFGDRDAQCWGVLKLENRRPEGTDFGLYDKEVCKQFVIKQIVPTLKRLVRSPARRRAVALASGVLAKELGKPVNQDDSRWDERVQQVVALQAKRKDVTDKDCAAYLGVSRATYCRRKHDWKSERSGAELNGA